MMTLKELRMWHWRQALLLRKNARRQQTTRIAEIQNEVADFHIKAVQCLNDFVPGTAEDDFDKEINEAVNKGDTQKALKLNEISKGKNK